MRATEASASNAIPSYLLPAFLALVLFIALQAPTSHADPVHAPSSQSLPPKVDISTEMPPVRGQGQQFSCVAWAAAYYYKSFQEQKLRHWGYSEDHLFSPSYIYNQIATSNTSGLPGLGGAFEIIQKQGVSTLDQSPYNERDWSTKPTPAARDEAAQFKAQSIQPLPIGLSGRDAIRQHLAIDHDPVVVGVPVYVDAIWTPLGDVEWDNGIIGAIPPVWDLPSASNLFHKVKGLHAVTIVGYDDDTQLFKFINSWVKDDGSKWGDDGFGYMTYTFFIETASEAWIMVSAPAPQPEPEAVSCPQPTPGQLFQGSGETVYVYIGGALHGFPDPKTLSYRGYDSVAIQQVGDDCLQSMDIREMIPSALALLPGQSASQPGPAPQAQPEAAADSGAQPSTSSAASGSSPATATGGSTSSDTQGPPPSSSGPSTSSPPSSSSSGPAPSKVTLDASATQVSSGATVTLTAQTDKDVGSTLYSIYILRSNGSAATICGKGKQCTVSVSYDKFTSETYMAVVGRTASSDVVARSSGVQVSWTSPGTAQVQSKPSTLVGDVNHDCVVDQKDRDLVERGFTPANKYDPNLDLNSDGVINTVDVAIVQKNLGQKCPSSQTAAVAQCNQATKSGGSGITTTVHEMGRTSGTFRFYYEAYNIPDKIEIFYENKLIYSTGTLVSSYKDVQVSFGPGQTTSITVVVTGNTNTSTEWTYTVYCPT